MGQGTSRAETRRDSIPARSPFPIEKGVSHGVHQKQRFCGSTATRTALTAAAFVLVSSTARTQGLTGALIGTVKDGGGGVLQGATVRITSPALMGGPATQPSDDRGQFRFPALPPGAYVLEVSFQGFTPAHEDDVRIAVGATIERTFALQPAGPAVSLVVEGTGSRLEARDSGFSTRFGPETLPSIPVRRSSMFDAIRAAPGVSPTSPSSGSVFSISAFGSGTNENQFLFDGTNFTCPCSGQARSEPGIDFIQEVQIQSVGASAEYGNMQGAVISVVTRQGSDRFLSTRRARPPPGLTATRTARRSRSQPLSSGYNASNTRT